MRIFSLELDNDIKGIAQRKQYIESLIAALPNPDLVILPELAFCSYMASEEIWQYADSISCDTSAWAVKTGSLDEKEWFYHEWQVKNICQKCK